MALCATLTTEPLAVLPAAEELWRALHAPLQLKWEVPLEGGFQAALVATMAQGTAPWPPARVQLELSSGGEAKALELQVPSNASVTQVAQLLTASCTLQGNLFGQTDTPSDGMLKKQKKDPLLEDVDVIDQCQERKIAQLQSLDQWHDGVCGHHALFNLRCLLRDELDSLRDEQRFWQQVIADVQRLAHFGELSGSWPRSRVVCGVADEVHLRHLVEQDEELTGRITLASTIESLKEQLRGLKISDVHGFLLGAATHWYSAAVVRQSTGVRIYFFDSYNVPVVSLRSNEDIEGLVEQRLHQSRSRTMESLRKDPHWAHRPQNHLEEAVDGGVEEWWKGVRKASMFWRHKPLEVKRELQRMDLLLVRDFLHLLLAEYSHDPGP
ncbi:unnamed protein product [Durusdinium trenchii]|uniref:Ubiquitinyl hydrolase 1 n=1 Tax=Durusdinium trenchii TaxID=1381693 RepID=A0ABP0K321_9DINO